jgi:hypothetical protein
MSDEFVDDFADQEYTSPNAKGLPILPHAATDIWRCRVCHWWPNIDSRSRFCIQCGRDYFGNRGTIPDRAALARTDFEKKK